MLELDTGVYYPIAGISNNEIASKASSQHLCQGFGRLSTRGSQEEYIELIKGDLPSDPDELFEGIDTSWSRVKGGEAIGEILYTVESEFDFTNPVKHLPQLLEAHKLVTELEDQHWSRIKQAELEVVISAVCGLYLEASSVQATAYPGSMADIDVEALNRSGAKVLLKGISVADKIDQKLSQLLKNNEKFTQKFELPIAEDATYSNPYWLSEPWSKGMYNVGDIGLIGKPESPSDYTAIFDLEINGYELQMKRPVIHRYSKPDKGELYQPFSVLPKATASFADKVIVFADNQSRDIVLTITSHKDSLKGQVALQYPEGWSVENPVQSIEITKKRRSEINGFYRNSPRH